MWHEGSIGVHKDIFHYRVKTCEEVSEEFGLDGGWIIKLVLKRNGEWVCYYERCWDKKPVDKNTEIALEILKQDYN